MAKFKEGDRVRTNDAYMAVGGPRASRKPFGALVLLVADDRIKVVKDGTHSPQWMKPEWFAKEPTSQGA